MAEDAFENYLSEINEDFGNSCFDGNWGFLYYIMRNW